jgi:DNA-binding GntR family transcriptional regulator
LSIADEDTRYVEVLRRAALQRMALDYRHRDKLDFTELIAQRTGIATVEEWARLTLNESNSRVLRVTRVRRDGKAVALEKAVLHLERLPGLIADASDITELAQC